MYADLECYDDEGYATLTAGTLFGRSLGQYYTGGGDGSVYVPGLTSAGAEPWLISMPQSDAFVSCMPTFYFGADTVGWYFSDFYGPGGALAPRIPCTFVVGTN